MSTVRVVSSHPGGGPLTLERLSHLFGGSGSDIQFVDAGSSPVRVADKFRQSIFIGVGGTGQKILRRLKAKMYRYGLNTLPCFAMVALDTAPKESAKQSLNGGFVQEVALDNMEFVHTPVTAPARFIAEVHKCWNGDPCSQNELASWLPKDFAVGAVTAGAEAKRAVGRFAFYVNAARIKTAMDTAFNRVCAADIDQQMQSLGVELDKSSPPTVYVVGSVCGGTGSGMILDVAYRARELLGQKFVGQIDTHGILVTNFPKADASHRANAYAALTEINYFSLLDTEFRAIYKDEAQEIRTQKPPFDTCYLLGGTSDSGHVIDDISDLADIIAEFMFVANCTSSSKEYFAALSNAGRDSGTGAMVTKSDAIADGRRPKRFSGLGIQSRVMPYDWIMKKLGSDYCARILGDIISGTNGLADAPLAAADTILDQFSANNVNSFRPLASSEREMQTYLNEISSSSLGDGDDLALRMQLLRIHVLKGYAERIQTNGIAVIDSDMDEFWAAIDRQMDRTAVLKESGGFAGANDFATKIGKQISTLKSAVGQEAKLAQKPTQPIFNTLSGLENDAGKPGIPWLMKGKKEQLAQSYKAQLQNLVSTEWKRQVYEHALAKLDEISNRLELRKSGLGPTIRNLESARAEFAKRKAEATAEPAGLPVFSKPVVSAAEIERAYHESELADTSAERTRFADAISGGLGQLADMNSREICYAMDMWAWMRFNDTILRRSASSLVVDSLGGDEDRVNGYIGDLYADTCKWWALNPAVAGSPAQADFLTAMDESGNPLQRAAGVAIGAGDTKGESFASQQHIADSIWMVRTAHGVSVDALIDLEWFSRSFDETRKMEGNSYLFTHREYPKLMSQVLARPGDVLEDTNLPRLWALGLAYGVIKKGTETPHVDLYIVQEGHDLIMPKTMPLAKARVEAYRKFRSDKDVIREVSTQIEDMEGKPAEERVTYVESQIDQIRKIGERLRKMSVPDKDMGELLNEELVQLQTELRELLTNL